MSNYQTTSIQEALKAITRPEPGSEWDQRIQQIPSPQRPKRTLKGDLEKFNQGLDKLGKPQQWKTRTLVKTHIVMIAVGMFALAGIDNHNAAAAKTTTPTTVAAVASKAPAHLGHN